MSYLPKDEQIDILDKMLRLLTEAKRRVEAEPAVTVLRMLPKEIVEVHEIMEEMAEEGFLHRVR